MPSHGLSDTSAQVVRATLPVVGGAIDEIAVVFYRRLFEAHPELERDLFNHANQARGDQQQALAASVATYATLLVDENGPDPRSVLARVANKHASLGVVREQYPVVHDHLFAAIVEVLGDAVTPEVAAAWDEVYWNMANALIAIETGLYAEAGVAPGDVWHPLQVRERVQESPDTVRFVLTTPDGSPLPAVRPGQYVSVAVHLPDGSRQIRQYSLIQVPDRSAIAISVKAVAAADDHATPAGEVSNLLHANVFEGDVLEVSPPFGELALTETETPLVLVSAGIGVAPMLGFLHHLAAAGSTREVLVLHADQSPARHAHRAELKGLVERLPNARLQRWYEDLGVRETDDRLHAGLMDLAGVAIPAGADVYLCGPLPFMAAVQRAVLDAGVPAERIHHEVFTPDHGLAAA